MGAAYPWLEREEMKFHRPVRLVATVALTFCLAAPGFAARNSPVNNEAGDPEGHQGAGVVLPRNAIGLVVGGTYESEKKETFFTLGIEYSRELSHRWAFTPVAEYLNDIDAWVFVTPFSFRPGSKHVHPKSHVLLTFGPGLEHKGRRLTGVESGAHAGETEVEQGENLFLFRTGIRYPVHLGSKYMVVPAIDFDFVREDGEWVDAVVFDVTVAFTF
jgi:hypothetical protein